MESYILFDDKGENAILNKDHKKVLDTFEISPDEDVLEPGEYMFNFAIKLPNKIESGTFYHAG